MEGKILLVQGDDLPRISLTVVNKSGEPVDLTGCTGVKALFKQRNSSDEPVELACEVDIPTSQVEIGFVNNELDTVLGDCEARVSFYFGLMKQTVPAPLRFWVSKS